MKQGSLIPLLAAILAITGNPVHADDGSVTGGTLIVSQPYAGAVTRTVSAYAGSNTFNGVIEISGGTLNLGINNQTTDPDSMTAQVGASGISLGVLNLQIVPLTNVNAAAPPRVVLNSTSIQTGLGGLATGGGIGILPAVDVPQGNVDLLAPSGVVDAQTATLRLTTGATINASSSLVKTGSGTLILNAGAMNPGGSPGLLSASVLTFHNGTVTVRGTMELGSAEFAGSINYLGASGTIAASTVGGSLTINGGNITTASGITLANASANLIGGTRSGTLILTNSSFIQMADFVVDISTLGTAPSGENMTAAVPEPGVTALLLVGVAASLCQRRRTRA